MDFSNIPHWVVDGKRYFNQSDTWLAQCLTSKPARFCLYEDALDSVDWSQDPKESWDELLLIRCLQLRQKYKHLVLLYSGGRDSHCILQSFAKFNIPIDEILLVKYTLNPVRANEYETWQRPLAEQYKAHNPLVQITTISVGIEDYKKFYNETWSERDRATLVNGFLQPADYTWLVDQKYHATGSGTGIVTGLEKPELVIKNHHIYSTHTDRAYLHFFHNKALIDFFFVTPDLPLLHVKQCWLVVNYLREHYPKFDEEFLKTFQHAHRGYYDEFSLSAGRGPAIDKNSPSQNGTGKYSGNHPTFQVVKKIIIQEAPKVWNHYKENLDFFYEKTGSNSKLGQSRPDSFWLGARYIESKHYLITKLGT